MWDDVLVVAPYNVQVTLLGERLASRGVRVDTVDKFPSTAKSGSEQVHPKAVVRRRYRPGAVGHVFRKPTLTSLENGRSNELANRRAALLPRVRLSILLGSCWSETTHA